MSRFEVRVYLPTGGYVVVDIRWEHPMIGPYPKGKKGRELAYARAAQFERDPSEVPR